MLLGEGDDLVRLKPSTWADCERKLYDSLELLEYIYDNEQDEDRFWQLLGKLCAQSYWAFLRVVLGYRWMDPYWHGEEISNFIEHSKDQNKVIILPRSSGKTAMITTTYPVWKICQNPFALCQITNAAEDKASSFLSTVAALLIKNPRIKRMYPLIMPEKGKWSTKGYKLDTERMLKILRAEGAEGEGSIERTDPTLRSYGMRGNITGAHVTLQLHDDLISHEVAISRALLARAEAFLREGFRVVDAHGEVIVAGTRWVYYDFYGKILEGDLQANGKEWRMMKRGIFKPDGTLVWPQRTFIDMSGNISVAGYTEEQVEGFKKDPYYAALYLSDPKQENASDIDTTMVNVFESLPFPVGYIDRVVFETNGGGEVIANAFVEQCRKEGRHEIKIGKVRAEKGEKHTKISIVLGNEVNNGRFRISRLLWKGNDGLGQELREFPGSKHDDLLDCVCYIAKIAREPKPNELPRPVIIVDPAWTTKSGSDPTAIVCGLRMNGDLWILDAKRLRTSRPEVLAQEIFRMYYQWNNAEKKAISTPKKVYSGVRSFRSLIKGKSARRSSMYNGGFTVDLSSLGFKK